MSKQTYHPDPQVSRLFWNNPLLYLKFCYVCERGLIYGYFFLSYSFWILFGDVGPIRFSCFCILNLKKTICLERNKRMNYDFIFNRVLHKFPLRLSVRLSLKQIAEHSEIYFVCRITTCQYAKHISQYSIFFVRLTEPSYKCLTSPDWLSRCFVKFMLIISSLCKVQFSSSITQNFISQIKKITCVFIVKFHNINPIKHVKLNIIVIHSNSGRVLMRTWVSYIKGHGHFLTMTFWPCL